MLLKAFLPLFPPGLLFYLFLLFQFYLPPEAAYNCVAQLGELGKFCNNYMDVIAMMADFVMTDIMMVTVR